LGIIVRAEQSMHSTLQCDLLEGRQVLHMNGSINVQDRYRRLELYANNCPKISNGDVTSNLLFGLCGTTQA
jgi:hypothetical protein